MNLRRGKLCPKVAYSACSVCNLRGLCAFVVVFQQVVNHGDTEDTEVAK